MKPECAKFIESMGRIPRNELLHVKNAIDAHLALSKGNDGSEILDDEPEIKLIVGALLSVLRDLKLHSGSYRALVVSRVFRGNRGKLNVVGEWAAQVRDKFARGALYEIAFRCLHKYLIGGLPTRWDAEHNFLARNRGPVGVREMLIFLDYVPSVVENSFPGYAEAGILYMIPMTSKRASR